MTPLGLEDDLPVDDLVSAESLMEAEVAEIPAAGAAAVTVHASEPPVGEPPGETVPLSDPPAPEPPASEPASPQAPITDPPAPGQEPGGPPVREPVVAGSTLVLDEFSTALEPVNEDTRPEGSTLHAPSGTTYRIGGLLKTEAGIHHYAGEASDGSSVRIREACDDSIDRLKFEVSLLEGVRSPMLPALRDHFAEADRYFLVTEELAGPTLAEALGGQTLSITQVVAILAQVAHATRQMHAAGWAHLGLRPGSISLGRPVRLTDLTYATRIGEKPRQTFYHAGYSAPELILGGPVDAAADIYSIGALLFHAIEGQPIAETGVELSTWDPPRPVAGVPQILERTLGPKETRYASVDLLHRDLLRLARRLAPPVRYSVAAATSIGLEPGRTTNQDAYVWLTGATASEEGRQEWAVLCVSDGMGGMAAGEVASHAAVRRLALEAGPAMARFGPQAAEAQVELPAKWMHAANDSATDAMERLRVRGGATLVCACVVGRRLTIAHVGDCRIYLLRGPEIRQLNRDHSLVMAMALQGQIQVEEIRNHPDRSTITRSLGDRRPLPDAHVDTLRTVTGEPTLGLEPGDVLLLCSDGLCEPVVEPQMLRTVREYAPDLAAAADALVQLALDGGGPDNIAVMLFRLDHGVLQGEKRECSTSF